MTAPSLFGAKFVMPIVTEYLLRYPEVSAACWLLDRVVNMLDEGIDIAVCIGELRDSSMRAIRVGQARRVICAAPSYLAAHSLPHVPADLARHRIVWAGAVTTTPEWHVDDSGQPVTVRLQPRLITTTNDSAIVAAVEGFGLTRLLSYQVAAQLRAGQLKIVLSEFDPVHCPFNWCTARVGTPPRRRGHSLIWPSSGSGPIPP